MRNATVLAGDIGGTNARFALGRQDGKYACERVLQCADFESPEAAITAYLDDLGVSPPSVMCIAAAGPIVDGSCNLTNNGWQLSEAALQRAFAVDQVRLINDFAAIANGLPGLSASHCEAIGPGHGTDLRDLVDFDVAVMGPGTGLGVAGLVGRRGALVPLVSEAGHTGFAPETPLQRDLLNLLSRRFNRVSCERLISGPGLQNVFGALGELEGRRHVAGTAADIFSTSRKEPTSLERRATDVFFEVLGQFAGDLTLTLGAYDGLFIAGGIVQRYPSMLAASAFRAGFERKGRHRQLLERVPTSLITHPNPGLFGAVEAACRLASPH